MNCEWDTYRQKMSQLHKKFTNEQVKVLLDSYEKGHLGRDEIQNTLNIGKTRFFALLKLYRISPENFSIDYYRKNKSRLSKEAEDQIQSHLLQEKELIDNKDLPITTYNYAAIADRLKKVLVISFNMMHPFTNGLLMLPINGLLSLLWMTIVVC